MREWKYAYSACHNRIIFTPLTLELNDCWVLQIWALNIQAQLRFELYASCNAKPIDPKTGLRYGNAFINSNWFRQSTERNDIQTCWSEFHCRWSFFIVQPSLFCTAILLYCYLIAFGIIHPEIEKPLEFWEKMGALGQGERRGRWERQ